MVFKVILSELALQDLKEIATFIGLHDPDAAQRYCHQMLDHAEGLALNPMVGVECPEFGEATVRSLVFRNHRIIYLVDAAAKVVQVSRFWHGARGFLSQGDL